MLKSFSLYTISSIIDKGISFLLLPVFTFYLSTSDFGSLSLLNTIFNFTLPVVMLGAQGAISVNYFKKDKTLYPSYFSSSIVPPFLITVVITLVVVIAGKTLERELNLPAQWLIVIPFFVFCSFFNSLLLTDCQIKNQPLTYVILSLSSSIATILISVFFVVKIHMGYEGRLYGQYLTILIFFIISFYILAHGKKVLVTTVSVADCKDSLSFGLPLLPHTLGFMVINMADRFFINNIWGKDVLGVYNIGFLIGSVISILSSAFSTSIVPFCFESFHENTRAAKIKVIKVYWMFVGLLLLAGIAIVILAPLIFHYFIDKKFIAGLTYVKWITMGYFFQGIYLLFTNVIFYLKKTRIFFYCSFFNVGLNLTLNYLFINKYGAIGATYAFLISSIMFCTVIAVISNKLYPLPWFYFKKSDLSSSS